MQLSANWSYHKIPKISPGAYIFQRPFLRGLYVWRGLSWREICISKSIGLDLRLEGNLPFLLCFYLRAISKYKPPRGVYIWRSNLMEGFLHYQFGGLIFAGAYTWRDLFLEFYGILSAHAIIIIIITIRAALAELNPWLIQFA